MPYDIKRTAALLRASRAYKNEARSQAAANAGIAVSTLETYESGKNGMSLENAWILADYYGKSLDELVGRKWPA